MRLQLPSPAMMRPHTVWALIVLCLLALTLPAGAVAAPASHPLSPAITGSTALPMQGDNDAGDSVNGMMVLDRLSPMLITADDDVTVEVVVTNTSDEKLTDASVSFNLMRYRISTRSALAQWEQQGLDATVGTHMGADNIKDLDPGDSARAKITVPARDFQLLAGEIGWGPRGISLVLGGTQEGEYAPRVDIMHTYILWNSRDKDADALLDLATAVPVTGPAVNPGDASETARRYLEATGTDSRLSSVLDLVQRHDFVSLAVDPELVQGVADATVTPMSDLATTDDETGEPDAATSDPEDATEDGTEGEGEEPGQEDNEPFEPTIEQQSSSEWLSSVTDLKDHEVFSLFPFDADLAAYAVAESAPQPVNLSTYTVEGIESWKTGLSWLTGDSVATSTLHTSLDAKQPWTLLEPGPVTDPTQQVYTTSSATPVETPNGDVTMLVSDAVLSGLLTTPGTSSPVMAQQRLISELTVIAKEQPSEVRGLLISVPRDWAPDTEVAGAQLEALASLPWVENITVEELAEESLLNTTTYSLPEAPQTTELPSFDTLVAVTTLRDKVRQIATVTSEPSTFAAGERRQLAGLLSVAWRDDQYQRGLLLDATQTLLGETVESLQVVTNPDINLISTGSEIPLTVRNRLDQDISVTVRLTPSDSTLRVPEDIDVDVPAGTSAAIRVPVEAAGSGDVDVAVDVLNQQGDVAASAQSFTVRVRADWENTGTIIIIGLLVILLGGGVLRTLRRGRSQRRTTPVDVHETIERLKVETEGGPAADTDAGHHDPHEDHVRENTERDEAQSTPLNEENEDKS